MSVSGCVLSASTTEGLVVERTRKWSQCGGMLEITQTQSVPVTVIEEASKREYLTDPPILKCSENCYDADEFAHTTNTYDWEDLQLRQSDTDLEVWGAMRHSQENSGWASTRSKRGELELIARVQAGAVQREPSEMAKVAQIFKQFDDNGDGLIDKNELSNTIETLGLTELLATLDEFWSKWDHNGDGFLNYDEFLAWTFSPKCASAAVLRQTIKSSEVLPGTIQVIVSMLDADSTANIELDATSPVEALKEKIQERLGHPKPLQILLHGNRKLPSAGATLGEIGVGNGSQLTLVLGCSSHIWRTGDICRDPDDPSDAKIYVAQKRIGEIIGFSWTEHSYSSVSRDVSGLQILEEGPAQGSRVLVVGDFQSGRQTFKQGLVGTVTYVWSSGSVEVTFDGDISPATLEAEKFPYLQFAYTD